MIQTPLTALDDLGASWQTRGKWSMKPGTTSEHKYTVCDGYGTISIDNIQPWHVDASMTDDEGFTGTMSFPMVKPGRLLHDDQNIGKDRGFGIMGMDHCSPTLWASLWSLIPGSVVSCPGANLLGFDQIELLMSRHTWLKFREYAKALTLVEAAELKASRDKAEQERYEREREREAEYETPIINTKVTWKGREYDPPSLGELREWLSDSVCETPDGEQVEPDHPDSWLSLLGMI